jgi:hypothetical protein
MIEIIIILILARHIGNAAADKGLKKLGYQIMAVVLWLSGEIFGGMLGSVIFGSNSSFWLRYSTALLGAIAGAAIAFLVLKLVPEQESLVSQNDIEVKKEVPPAKKFGRSVWIPVLVSFLAVTCLCAGVGVGFILQMRSVVQQIHASHPIIGVEIDSTGQIVQPVNEVSSKENAIYFSFVFDIPQGEEMPVTFDWYFDDQLAYSFDKTLGQGTVVVSMDREELGMPEFNKGNYKVVAHIGELFLTSSEFVVK